MLFLLDEHSKNVFCKHSNKTGYFNIHRILKKMKGQMMLQVSGMISGVTFLQRYDHHKKTA